jgi:hypothetical protein
MNIERMRVELDTRCPMCNTLFEDGGHLFIRCPELVKAWGLVLPEVVRLKMLQCTSSLEFFYEILELPSANRMKLVAQEIK